MDGKFYAHTCLVFAFYLAFAKAAFAIAPLLPSGEPATLEPPYLEPYPFTSEETNIGIFIGSYNDGAVIELYRSTNSTTGYALIKTFTEWTEFTDYDLKPRTTYYYRGRCTRDGQYSDYTYYSFTTASKWYEPNLTASMNASNSGVVLKFTDRSYQEEGYEFFRNGSTIPFYIDASDSGRVFTYTDVDIEPNTTYRYTVNAMLKNEGSPVYPDVAEATVTTPSSLSLCSGTGGIEREKWTNVSGRNVIYIPTGTPPNQVTMLTSFQAPTNDGDNYGVRVRGYVCPPISGNYVFWIASDDESQLFLSTDANPANKKKIAYVLDHTNPLDWNRYASQRSVEIHLEQGHLYYIEALHKEAYYGDNLAVGWQLPDGSLERPIPGKRLVKYEQPTTNTAPTVQIQYPTEGQTYNAPANVYIAATATDNETGVSKVEFYLGTNKVGEDATAPYTYQLFGVPAGQYKLEVRALDSQGAAGSAFVNFIVRSVSCSGTGRITREYWTNISGTSLSSVPFDTPPQSYDRYTQFETNEYEGTNYGSRMRAQLCVPQTGNYTFWIASDDNSQLWLSTDENPSNKRLIASVTGVTKLREYTKYTSQQSVKIPLEQGRTYYIEALHKEGTGNDFISVGWQLPDGTLERPIAGNRLIEIGYIGDDQPPVVSIIEPEEGERFTAPANILIRANASDPDGSVYKVIFEANSTVLAEDMTAPYEFQWNNVPAGNYTVIVRAVDNQGKRDSRYVNIVVGEQSCTNTGKME